MNDYEWTCAYSARFAVHGCAVFMAFGRLRPAAASGVGFSSDSFTTGAAFQSSNTFSIDRFNGCAYVPITQVASAVNGQLHWRPVAHSVELSRCARGKKLSFGWNSFVCASRIAGHAAASGTADGKE